MNEGDIAGVCVGNRRRGQRRQRRCGIEAKPPAGRRPELLVEEATVDNERFGVRAAYGIEHLSHRRPEQIELIDEDEE